MKLRNILLLAAAAAAFSVAGCGGDVAKQLVSNEQLRTQVLDTIAQNKDLAFKAIDKMLASDSLRAEVVDHLLQNDAGAQQVLVRIGTNPQALDMVMNVAVKDSTMRGHLLTLMKGVEMASAAQK